MPRVPTKMVALCGGWWALHALRSRIGMTINLHRCLIICIVSKQLNVMFSILKLKVPIPRKEPGRTYTQSHTHTMPRVREVWSSRREVFNLWIATM